MSWGAVLAGALVGVVTHVMLGLLGIAFGLWAFDPQDGFPATLTMIWLVVSGLVAFGVAGWVAGRESGTRTDTDGALHGIISWALATVVATWVFTGWMGGLAGGVANVVGTSLDTAGSAAGAVIGAVAPEAYRAAVEQVRSTGLSLEDIRAEAGEILRQTETAALSPDSLAARAESVEQAARRSADDVATTPTEADEEFFALVERVVTQAEAVARSADREAAVNVLVARTDMSEAEAGRTIDRWTSQYQEAVGAVERAYAEAAAYVRSEGPELAEDAASTVANTAFLGFVLMALGATSAAVGGGIGATSPTREERAPTVA